jgi:hypothetical protein
LAVLCGVVGAIFLPRVFAGEINILTVDRNSAEQGAALYALHPVSGNLTQSGYALGAVLAFASMRVLLEKPGRLVHFRDAVLLLGSLDCVAALLNLGEFHLGFPPILKTVRTAYSLFDAYEGAGGLMRIHGTFPEASGFSGFTLPLFAFAFSLWLHSVRPLYSGTIAALTLTFLLISTSTTAYVGLALYITALLFVLTYRGYVRGTVPKVGMLVAGALLATVMIGSIFVFETAVAQRLEDYLAITVFDKLDSQSGIERSSWNRQAWSNFVDTWGLGVGLGSARASSLPLVLVSNLGLLGSLFYAAFLKRVVGDAGIPGSIEPISEASRQAVLGALAAAFVSCAVFDLGIAFYAFAAGASAASMREIEPRLYGYAPDLVAARRR